VWADVAGCLVDACGLIHMLGHPYYEQTWNNLETMSLASTALLFHAALFSFTFELPKTDDGMKLQ
jgi:hypothetical protein